MAIAVATSRQNLADRYGTQATWIGTATADPGTAATPASESTGGTPAYARKQTTWASGTGGVITGSAVTIDLPASTVTYMPIFTAATGNTMWDKALITSTVLSAQGQLIITPTYTQS